MFKKFVSQIKKVLSPEQIIEDELLRYAYSTDASIYRLLPQLVLIVKNEPEIIKIINYARQYQLKLTFRAAGTSLSGQAVTDQILVMLAQDSWLNYTIHANGSFITLEPGIIGANANKYLRPYNRRIGPDPGSINAAKIGGIIANNSSGMCCGTSMNSYSTIKDIRAILADGSIFDSSKESTINEFRMQHSTLLEEITKIQKKIFNDPELMAFIRKKFAIKNTSGYSLNAFLDYKDPIKILERLMVGSEGTLGFVSQVSLSTVADNHHKALNLVYGQLSELIKLTVKIAGLGVSAVELLDYFSLQSVKDNQVTQSYIRELPDNNHAAIMIEVSAEDQKTLLTKIDQVNQIISQTTIYDQLGFNTNPSIMANLWKIRGGILPTIAGKRPLGSSVLIEDVAVEINLLPELIQTIRQLFTKFGYENAAIFGHVLAGNIHFVVTPNFTNPDEVKNYDLFMHEFTDLIANQFNGSLKAEHGSGRNISPFAIVEWGEKCWNLMWEIKNLLDPDNMFNPDVKLTRDYTLHMKHLKEFPSFNESVDECMECGFCEPVCPSRSLSLTPRQRISVSRHISTLEGSHKQIWNKKFEYYGIETCATTGMCKTVCPVGINTGEFILNQKPLQNQQVEHPQEIQSAKNKINLGHLAAKILGPNNLNHLTSYAHNKIKSIPVYLNNTPKAQQYNFQKISKTTNTEILLLPACPNRIFANKDSGSDYPSKLILDKMGFKVEFIDDLTSTCCGQMYHSKRNQIQEVMAIKDIRQKTASNLKVVVDNSSCAAFALEHSINLIDINKFIVENLNRNKLAKRFNKIALHPDCSTEKYFFNQEYLEVLQLCCNQVIIPEGIKCCGFAGDKGFITPELNSASLSGLAKQINDCDIGITFNRSCQIGLSHHGKLEYISFVELILKCFIN